MKITSGALIIVSGGAALLLFNGLQSPPGLWYAAASIVAGAMMVAYAVVSSPTHQRPTPAPEPTSPSTSTDSATSPKANKTDAGSTGTEQTTESTESVDQEPEEADEEDLDPSDPPTSEKQLEQAPTSVMKSQPSPVKTQQIQQSVSYSHSSQTGKTARTSTRQKRQFTSATPLRRNSSARTDNPYFKPVDISHEIRFAQVDRRFSYLDVDVGPEFIGFDPIPDLIEVDIGPSAVSHELVHSPIEIKISSFLKPLLAPTPSSSGTTAPIDSSRPMTSLENRAHRQTDDTCTGRRQAHDPFETSHRQEDRQAGRRSPVDSAGYGGWEDTYRASRGGPDDSVSWGHDPGTRKDPVNPSVAGVSDDLEPVPVYDEGQANGPSYEMEQADSPPHWDPPRWEPPQWDAEPLGLDTVDPGFPEHEGPAMESVEPAELGFGTFDYEPVVPIEEPVMDPKVGEEMFELGGFTGSPEDMVKLPGLGTDTETDALFPDAESFGWDADPEEDWLWF